ncbi:MAG: hypoxanthine phosphoribosyltransferase [Bifidobacteriaceae bacterium]|nr:hypoxanthine phosphoribosyltransferase [Bifidobacteriaceae bacterium]
MEVKDVANNISEVLFTEEQLYARLDELAAEIDAEYEGKEPPVLVGILRGSVPVTYELAKRLKTNVRFDWVAISSYQDSMTSTGKFLIEKDITLNLQGKNVIVVDDIYDTGDTLLWMKGRIKDAGATNVDLFALLEKPEVHKHSFKPKYVGFEVPNKFVVGFGLDFRQQYRHLRAICVLSPHVYEQ